MSVFLQYQLAQTMGDLGGGATDGSAGAAGAGFGLGMGLMMPLMIARSFRWPWPLGPSYAVAPHTAPPMIQARFCGHCGGGLLSGAHYCGYCGQAIVR